MVCASRESGKLADSEKAQIEKLAITFATHLVTFSCESLENLVEIFNKADYLSEFIRIQSKIENSAIELSSKVSSRVGALNLVLDISVEDLLLSWDLFAMDNCSATEKAAVESFIDLLSRTSST